ncbi:wax ester/triacylglycerol synthase domain-containing protein [Mycobacterium sp. ML4]
MIIIEGSDGLSHQLLGKLLATSLPNIPRFRSRLVAKPLGLGRPVWAEIDDYDPAPQIHSTAVPAPHDEREFTALVGQLATASLDRHRPLWDAWSIEGLEGGRWALAIRTSTSVTEELPEGIQTVWAQLVTPDPRVDVADVMAAEPVSGATPAASNPVLEAVFELLENSVASAGLVAAAVPAALDAAGRRLRATVGRGLGQETYPRDAPVPPTVFNAQPTSRRAVAFGSIRLSHLRAIAYAFGGTVTNAALAACTLSLRTWLRHHDVIPDYPLVMQVPRSLLDDDSHADSIPLASTQINLPVHVDDPVQVLLDMHAAANGLGLSPRQAATSRLTVDFSPVASLLSPRVVHAGLALATRLPCRRRTEPACHGTISYVPWSSAACYCGGAKVVGMHTVTPLVDRCGLSITMASHDNAVDLGVCVCPDHVPRVDVIASGIVESVDILLAAARQSPRGQGPSVITRIAQRSRARRGQ